MPKKKARKKYPRLPSGFGSIRYLGEGRRNPYAVTLPATVDALGNVKRPTPLCYVDDWYKGFAVLTAYKAGTYTPGMEKTFGAAPSTDRDVFVERVLADLNLIKGMEAKDPDTHEKTFAEVFNDFWWWKYERPEARKLSKQSRSSTRSAYKNCKPLWDRPFCQIKATELQKHLDSIKLKYSSLSLVLSLFHQMYAYADLAEICKEDRSKHVAINIPDDNEHGVPLSEDDLRILWRNRDDENVQMILIMCYSGFRISEYKEMKEINLEKRYFYGGMKTEAGIERYVPIHSRIYPFVVSRIKRYGCLIPRTVTTFRNRNFAPTLKSLGITSDPSHTPHDTRHTFSALCEKFKVAENDRKRMLGHRLSDITNSVYGHRTVEELREEIEKIQLPDL